MFTALSLEVNYGINHSPVVLLFSIPSTGYFMTQSPGPIDEKIQCQLMVRFNNYFGLAVAVLVARDDPLYGPFERGRQKLISFLVCYRPLALEGKRQRRAEQC